MSKYNLTDIFEQYRIGSGFTTDFDYEGMLNTGLGTSIDTPIEVLRKISDDFEDVNYHRENNHLQNAIDAIEIGDMMEAQGKLSDFHAEIRKTMETFDMDTSDDLGAYMASKMDLEEGDAVDLAIEASQEKAGIKEVTSQVGSRIEGLLNIPMKKKFLDVGVDLIQDVLEDDLFDITDIIEHLAIELEKYYDGFLSQGDRLAGMEESDNYVDEIGEGAMQPGEADLEAGEKGTHLTEDKMIDTAAKMIKDRILKDVPMDIIMDFVKTHLQDIRKMSNSEIKDEFEEFRSVNYDYNDPLVSIDENLKEHFGRFMKDYQ